MKLQEALEKYKEEYKDEHYIFIEDQDGCIVETLKRDKDSYYKDCELIKLFPLFGSMIFMVEIVSKKLESKYTNGMLCIYCREELEVKDIDYLSPDNYISMKGFQDEMLECPNCGSKCSLQVIFGQVCHCKWTKNIENNENNEKNFREKI